MKTKYDNSNMPVHFHKTTKFEVLNWFSVISIWLASTTTSNRHLHFVLKYTLRTNTAAAQCSTTDFF